jgi:hypothetical protein
MSCCGDQLLLWRVAEVANLMRWRNVGMKRGKDDMKSGKAGFLEPALTEVAVD